MDLFTNFEIMISKKVHFFFQNNKVSIGSRSALKSFIEFIFRNEKKDLCDLNIIFFSDNELLKFNKLYLGRNSFTDIITFSLSNSSSIVGEIYLSLGRIKENSATYKVSFRQELLRVIFHGVLHLCDYEDKTKNQKRIMSKKEDYYLDKWNNKISREK